MKAPVFEEPFCFIPQNYNILVVEDSTSIIKILDRSFSEYGFNTFLSMSLTDAREKILNNRIDYIILDINLPDGNGYELIKELSNSQIKIMVLTSQTDSLLKQASYQKGVIDFIYKDKNFLYKISEIPQLIKQVEKNKLKTILVVDDSYVIREQLKDIFINRNYKLLEASNINEALSIINNNKIDLMFLDLQLEDANGYDFLIKNRKTILDDLKIKVIFITGTISSNILRDAYRLGVREVIKKPYVLEELILKADMSINDKDIEDEVYSKTQLLNQYKNTVDRSFIVTKSDPDGIITYVNDSFCAISGYSESELIGHSHNIVRHKSMDDSLFKDMWETIKELKKPWIGKVKNRKKDGSDYWVQTIINPILDNNNNVLEYIAIRSDITQIEKTKDYLKKQYNISQSNFQEVTNISKLYETAMRESSIILRVNPHKVITYANEHFYNISGYTAEELVGKHYSYIKINSEVSADEIANMWATIEKGQIWKGQICNIFKDNKNYYFLVIVVPIINLNGEIIEYMSLRKDITEIIELNKEIEETQREVIYKMGEIGESRSNETGNHVKRVALYSKLLAQLYGLNSKDCDILFTASPMHDIGKVAIPDSILNKPSSLTPDEWEIMRRHTTVGYEILKNSNREILKAAAIVANEHHEKWNGTGYPRGLKGEDIHIYGRITAIADVFDALGSSRCYKSAWEDEKILKLLEDEKGNHFEPKLIDLFFENLDKFKEIRAKYRD